MLTRVAEDAERALRAIERVGGLLCDDQVGDAHELLRELIGQDFDIDEDGVPRLHRGTREDRILSLHDPEMRHGHKSRHRRFDGYKLHAAATNAERPLITAVEVTPANELDGPQAKGLVDSQPEARRPERLLGDTAYGTGPVRAELADRDVEVLAPVPRVARREGRIDKRDFAIDSEASTVRCPAGEVARIKTEPSGQRRAQFRKSACGRCPLKPRCVPTQPRKDVLIAPQEEPETTEKGAIGSALCAGLGGRGP